MRSLNVRSIAAILPALFLPALSAAQDLSVLKINEVQSAAGMNDYVEIYNAGDAPIDLVPLVLRDRHAGEANEHPFCLGRIEPHGRWIVSCPYFLNSKGEEAALFDEGGTCLDWISFPPFPDEADGQAFGRTSDGADTWCFLTGSPGTPNGGGCYLAVVDVRYSPIQPQLGEPVNVTAWIVAPSAGKVEVAYGLAPSPPAYLVPAQDDGLHGDGEAGDGIFGAEIPPLASEGIVQYTILVNGAVPKLIDSTKLFFHYGYSAPQIRINEVLSLNRKTGTWLPGSVGPFADYIELFNAGSSRVNVSQLLFRQSYMGQYGLPLHMSAGSNPLWLEPGAHLLVWASPQAFGLAPAGVGLSLSQNGEDLLLLAPDGVSVIDAVRIPPLGRDVAYGRDPEGTGPFRILYAPSPQGGAVYPPGVSAFIGSPIAIPFPAEAIPLRLWVSPELESPAGRAIYRMGDLQGEAPLINDGLHEDDLEGDEIWSATIPPLGRAGELEFAFEIAAGGSTYRNPALAENWHTIPVGTKPMGKLVINEILASRFDEEGACPDVWVPGSGTAQESKFIEIYNSGISLEDFHFVVTGSMFHWSTGLEFKEGHIADVGAVKAFPWDDLGALGGTLFLRGVETGTLYDAVTYPALEPGKSYGRSPDGGPWRILDRPSPGELNGPFPFVRGDGNDDEDIDLSDAVRFLTVIYLGDKTDCRDALDADDSGTLELTDPVYLLRYLFIEGPPPARPFPTAGTDESDDDLGCLRLENGGAR